MADELSSKLHTHPKPDILIAIPTSIIKQLLNSYNQAQSLATIIGDNLNINVDYQLCRKIRHTPRQATLNAKQRLVNLTMAFSAKKHQYQHIAIVDDTLTTGATVTELTRAIIRQNRNTRVDIWVIARTDFAHHKLHR